MESTSTNLKELTDLLSAIVASAYSDFYRSLYKVPSGSVPNLRTWDDWKLVPGFTKDALLERVMREYTFVPHKEIEAVYYTSGTSGKPPLFCGRLSYTHSHSHRKDFYDFNGALLSSVKAQHRQDLFLSDIGSKWLTINFDGKHVAASVTLAKYAGVTSLGIHTFTILPIGEEMKRLGINQNIRLIDFIGETCSLMLYSYMRATFPNAVIISSYGLSEIEGIVAVPCRALSDEEPYPVFHVHPAFHIDLIDPTSGEAVAVANNVEAEVLITDRASHRALPIVRYRPGDTVRVVEEKCKEHGQWTFTVLGKTASDFMLVPGGQLRADEIERVLRGIPEVTDHFEMHRYDSGTKEKPVLKVVLHVQAKDTGANMDALARKIEQELRVAPGRTYAAGVAEGRYEPLTCVPLVEQIGERKHKRMFKHATI